MAEEDLLAQRAVGGDAAAFDALVRLHQGAIRGFLRRLAGNDHALADDLAQETFRTAYRKIQQFVEGSFISWLYAIAWSRFLMQARRRKLEPLRQDNLPSQELFERGNLARIDLEKALGHVAPAERAAITLCLGLGYAHGEAAAILGLPVGTLKSRIARGRNKIKALLKESDYGP